jgi:hypothetical protein
MSWTQEELAALKSAYASGTLRVSYEGKTLIYGSESDLMRRIRIIERDLSAHNKSKTPYRRYGSFSKGL